MKKTRSLTLLLAALMVLALLGGCGETEVDVPLADVVSAVDSALNKGDALVVVDESYIKGYMKMNVADYAAYTVKINAYGANIDEFGIFQAKDANQAKDVKAAVEAYLQLRLDSWMDEYMPEEKPKLTAAEIKSEGKYVMYAILSDADKTAAFDAFAEALK